MQDQEYEIAYIYIHIYIYNLNDRKFVYLLLCLFTSLRSLFWPIKKNTNPKTSFTKTNLNDILGLQCNYSRSFYKITFPPMTNTKWVIPSLLLALSGRDCIQRAVLCIWNVYTQTLSHREHSYGSATTQLYWTQGVFAADGIHQSCLYYFQQK